MSKKVILLSFSILLSAVFIALLIFSRHLYFWQYIIELQKAGNTFIYQTINQIKTERSTYLVLMFMLGSFAYGIVHAIGPGHGKTILANYFITGKQERIHALITILSTAFTHIGVALVLAVLFLTVFSSIPIFARHELTLKVQKISGILLILFGMFLIVKNSFFKKQKAPSQMEQFKETKSIASAVFVGFVAGMIPCPLSMGVMLIAISYKVPMVGLVSLLGIAMGMTFLLTIVVILSVILKKHFLTLVDTVHKNKLVKIYNISIYLQALLFILIGSFLL